MTEESTYQTVTQNVLIARPKKTKALPVNVDDLAYLKKRISELKPEINVFLSLGFFFSGSSLACFLQVKFGAFQRTIPENLSSSEIILWCVTLFCLLLAAACFVFCYLRYKDYQNQKVDLVEYLDVLNNKFEA